MGNIKNLKELLSDYTIQIPPMQRDYAQGRNNEKNTRDLFLNTIYNHIVNNQEQYLNLDFIYGYNEKHGDDKNLILLDGQQRITTLWLLHMYFYGRIGNSQTDFLKKFTYAVRDSAKYACEYMHQEIQNFTEAPSKIFLASLNFGEDWAVDPTVKSLLTMYDAIYDRFKDVIIDNNSIDKLDKICFSLIDMEEYNLGEDLYIQMNSRGKALTMFENFKAWVMHDEKTNSYFTRTCSFENKWSEFFWDMSQSNSNESKDILNWYDEYAMRFVHYFGLYLRYKHDNKNNNIYNDFNHNLTKLNKSLYYINGQLSNEPTGLFTYETLLLMDKVISFIEYIKKNNVLFSLDRMNASDIMRLFAVITFVEENQDTIFYSESEINSNYDIQMFNDWYGFINRIIDNNRQQNDSDTVFATFMYLKNFAEHSSDIINNLSTIDNKQIPNYARESTKEEIIKAKLISLSRKNDLKWEIVINNAHSNDYFKGKILFLLKYSQINDEEYDISLFQQYYNAASAVFSPENLSNIHKLHRVFLSQYNYAWRNTNYDLGSGSYEMRLRLVWHKEFFLKTINSEYIFKKFLDIYQFNIEKTDILEYIIQNSLTQSWDFKNDWWRYLLVRFPKILSRMEKNRYYFESNNKPVYLLKTYKYSKNARNLLLCALKVYMEELSLKAELKETSIMDYKEYSIISSGENNNLEVKNKLNGESCTFEYNCLDKPEIFFDTVISYFG